MIEPGKKPPSGKPVSAPATLERAATGMEAELVLSVDGRAARPEAVFGSPRAFVRGALMHREGSSYHLPTGAAVYFDTGVIEVATPAMEIERGAAARAGRSLWESIGFLRAELDVWARKARHDVRLAGFSAHYNVSFERPSGDGTGGRSEGKLAFLLAHILPAPVMMLAANRRSTGVGVRPRGGRIEVTVDFTPSPSLTIATGTLVLAVVREVARWPSYDPAHLERAGIPVVAEFRPLPHTSRQGWLAGSASYPVDPFATDPDAPVHRTRDGRILSLRALAGRIVRRFWRPIRRISDPFTFRLIGSVIRGRAPALLDLPERPPEYEDVGRESAWENLFPEAELARSRYERVLIHAIRGERLRAGGRRLVPVGMRGWSAVVFRDEEDGSRRVIGIDRLIRHLGAWG